MNMLEQDLIHAYNYLHFIVNDGQTKLPSLGQHGSTLDWQVLSGEAFIEQSILYKTSHSLENEPIVLQVTASDGRKSDSRIIDRLILKDAYVASLMSYFTNGDDTRGMKIAYTYDGKDFTPLNKGRSLMHTTLGSKRMRDPAIFRKKDGTFGLAATQGWDNPEIYLFDTDGLTNFTNERLIPIASTIGHTTGEQTLTNQRAWAPEMIYDRISDLYYVYWSDPKTPTVAGEQFDRPIYYNTSSDLLNFSEPDVYLSVGSRMIDASILYDEGTYYLTYKGEEVGDKQIYLATSKTLSPGSFTVHPHPISDPGQMVEGPTLTKCYQDGSFYLYYDYFATHGVGYATTHTLSPNTIWHYVPKPEHGMAPSKVRDLEPVDRLISHCGTIAVTQSELDRLKKSWGTY